MKRVNLLSIKKPPRKNEWRPLLTSGQWDARYRALCQWYAKRAAESRREQYRQWAVFTIVDDVAFRVAA
jgi:hypothetical protein